jgi:membrane-associated phospholipid phosphatase
MTIIYFLVLSLIVLFFKHNQPLWLYYIIFNFSVIALILLGVKFLSFTNGMTRFIRHWYPVFLFTFLYEEIRYLVHIIFPGFFDFWINDLEFKLFGNYPTVFLQKYSVPVLNEYFLLAYFSYYFLLPVSGIALYFGKKIKEFDRMVFTSAVAFYISYLGFIFFPVEGPRYALSAFHKIPIKGFIFVPLAQWVVKVGGLHGGCMPSSHVAVACVVFVFSYRYMRKLFYFLGPLIVSLFIGTVWGRFHYFSDVLAGIIVGLLSLYLVEKIGRFRENKKEFNFQEKDISLDLIEKK